MPLPWIALPLGETYLRDGEDEAALGQRHHLLHGRAAEGVLAHDAARGRRRAAPRPRSRAAPAVPRVHEDGQRAVPDRARGIGAEDLLGRRARRSSLATTPPFRNSSATLTPPPGAPTADAAQVEHEALRAGAPQRLELARTSSAACGVNSATFR